MSATATNTERLRFETAPRHFLAHLATMPRWHKLVLLIGVGLDKWLHQHWIYIAGMIVGAAAGFVQIFRVVLALSKAN